MKTRRLTVRLSPELHEEVDALSQSTGKSESELVREAIQDYCEKHGAALSCHDIALKAGLIGCAKDLPADLSTNPRYMEGFGSD